MKINETQSGSIPRNKFSKICLWAFKTIRNLSALLIACIFFGSGCSPTKSEYASGSSFARSYVPSNEPAISYPTMNPSISEGRKVWDSANCASCHGDLGQGKDNKCKVNFADEFFMYRKTPIALYKSMAFELAARGKHPKIEESPQHIWDLVFFIRAFGCPPMTDKQLADIEPFYGANCAQCHGTKGYGDGVLEHSLEPRPANFHQYNRLFDRQDFMLFNHIQNGLYPAAMPPWLGYKDPHLNIEVDNRYVKKLVQYVRHFHIDPGDQPLAWWDEDKNGKPLALEIDDIKACCKPASAAKGSKEVQNSKNATISK